MNYFIIVLPPGKKSLNQLKINVFFVCFFLNRNNKVTFILDADNKVGLKVFI